MDEKLVQIITSVNRMFLRYGLKSVTMDDIARELGMSKKTLYVYFRDKNDMVVKTLRYFMEEHQCKLDVIYDDKSNAIDESFEIFKMVMEDMHEVKPKIFFDLKKYYPDGWKIYENFRTTHIPALVEENLKKGISEGLYRSDLNTRIISLAYGHLIHSIFENDYFPEKEFDFKTLYVDIFHYHIHGISSQKGLDYLNEKMKKISSAL
jgi:AcrR family transcriptional regulator